MRRFLLFFLFLVLSVLWFKDFVGSGRFLGLMDRRPDRRGTATALFLLGRYYEVFSRDAQAEQYYRRVVERYPRSRYGMEAHYGLASCYERLRQYDRALEEYQKFLESHPRSKYAASVRNNVEILKAR